MFDFFDEDFPLSRKQEEEYRKRLKKEKEAAEASEAEKAKSEASEEEQADLGLRQADTDGDVVIGKIESELGDGDGYEDGEDGYDDAYEYVSTPPAGVIMPEPEVVDDEPEPEPEPVPAPEADIRPANELYAESLDRIMSSEEPEAAEAAVEEAVEHIAAAAEEISETAEEISAENEGADDAHESFLPDEIEEIYKKSYDEPEEASEEPAKIREEEPEADDSASEAEKVLPEPETAEKAGPLPEAEAMNRTLASMDELEAHLHEELRHMSEKLDTMEKAVDEMEDGEISEGFDYAYDERYFAEEETPAYRHPELYGSRKKPEKKKEAASGDSEKEPTEYIRPTDININITPATLAKAGAVVAAAVVAAKLLKPKKGKQN